jgi:hypothetical protein
MPKDVIAVRHPEFARLQHQIAIATERFNQATKEKQGSLVFIGSQLTITAIEDFSGPMQVLSLDEVQ